MSMIDHRTMQIKVRIACKEPRNISVTMSGAKEYYEHNFILFGPKNITSGNVLSQTYRTYLPVSTRAARSPGSHCGPLGVGPTSVTFQSHTRRNVIGQIETN